MRKKIILCLLLLLTPILLLGNSAEPPSYIIIVPWADNTTQLNILVDDQVTIHGTRHDKFSESYFLFYRDGIDFSARDKTLLVKTDVESRIALPQQSRYNAVYTLDKDTMTLQEGKLPFRVIFFTSIRVVLTLLIEAAIFYAFGYRIKESYILFVIFNLITQGILAWYLHSAIVDFIGYFVMGLIFTEVIILALEALLFTQFVKEKRTLPTLLYVFLANITSFFVGYMLLQHLPF